MNQFASRQFTQGEELRAVPAGSRRGEADGTEGQLDRLAAEHPPPPRLLGKGPNVRSAPVSRLENEVFAVRSPASTTLRRRIIPTRQERAEMIPVRRHLPKRLRTAAEIIHREAEDSSVG